jgi:glycosyltransferase involved in cell wall biosynthesis
MLISIITPTFNSEKSIEKCVLSIINQNYKDFEHIIIDNLSNDKTLEIIKKLYRDLPSNLSIISEKDNGISDAFNKGIKAANGDIIAILNSDDFYFSNDVFEKVVNTFKDSKILFVHGNVLFEDKLYGSNIRKPLLCDVRKAMPYNHPTMFLRKKLYEEIGLYDNDLKYAMDFDLVCRMQKQFNNLASISVYLDSEPLAVMNAGGASWENEQKALIETKNALIKYNYWDYNSSYFYLTRKSRVILKKYLVKIGLTSFVKLWRNSKWR